MSCSSRYPQRASPSCQRFSSHRSHKCFLLNFVRTRNSTPNPQHPLKPSGAEMFSPRQEGSGPARRGQHRPQQLPALQDSCAQPQQAELSCSSVPAAQGSSLRLPRDRPCPGLPFPAHAQHLAAAPSPGLSCLHEGWDTPGPKDSPSPQSSPGLR